MLENTATEARAVDIWKADAIRAVEMDKLDELMSTRGAAVLHGRACTRSKYWSAARPRAPAKRVPTAPSLVSRPVAPGSSPRAALRHCHTRTRLCVHMCRATREHRLGQAHRLYKRSSGQRQHHAPAHYIRTCHQNYCDSITLQLDTYSAPPLSCMPAQFATAPHHLGAPSRMHGHSISLCISLCMLDRTARAVFQIFPVHTQLQ